MLGEVVLAIIAAIIGGLSLSLQKLGLDKTRMIRPKYLIKSKIWLAGILLASAAFTTYIFALSQGKIAIIQPLMETAMVFSIIFNYLYCEDCGVMFQKIKKDEKDESTSSR